MEERRGGRGKRGEEERGGGGEEEEWEMSVACDSPQCEVSVV